MIRLRVFDTAGGLSLETEGGDWIAEYGPLSDDTRAHQAAELLRTALALLDGLDGYEVARERIADARADLPRGEDEHG